MKMSLESCKEPVFLCALSPWSIKGLITGICIGYFAKKVNSLPLGILFGLAVGMLLAFVVAALPNPAGKHYYFEIMLPGSILGVIVGYATQRYKPGPHREGVQT